MDKSGAIPLNVQKRVRIPVQEGEVVGRTGRTGIDFSVRDTELVLPGFVVPEHYAGESWKIHSADLFEYFREPLRSQLLAKDLRQAEPRGGKIDYDIDGRLVGNWFVAGTNGYAGLTRGEGYWKTHLAIAYDALDPTGIVVSIGDWRGEARQFGVQGNAPDPKDVNIATGLVKYELLQPDWVVARTGKRWDRWRYADGLSFKPHVERVEGVILLQLVAPRTLKVATFPGKTALDVDDFAGAAKLYER
ncbi:MAG: hypothetical protein WD278_13730 [Pirellulales bacterium]